MVRYSVVWCSVVSLAEFLSTQSIENIVTQGEPGSTAVAAKLFCDRSMFCVSTRLGVRSARYEPGLSISTSIPEGDRTSEQATCRVLLPVMQYPCYELSVDRWAVARVDELPGKQFEWDGGHPRKGVKAG